MSDNPEHIDLQAIKRQHDLLSYVQDVTGQAPKHGNKFNCPLHNDKTPSFVVYPDGKWHCFGACNRGGDILDLMGLLLYGQNYDPHTQLKDVIDSLGSLNIQPARVEPKRPLAAELPSDLASRFANRMKPTDYDYWEGLNIPAVILERFQIGKVGSSDYRIGELWFPAGYWTFPYFYRGVLTGFKMRRDDRVIPTAQKYTSRGRKAAPYNIDTVLNTMPKLLLINEDEKSALALAAVGYVGISVPANQWRDEWNSLLIGVEDLVIIANNESEDKPGLASALKIQASVGYGRVLLPDYGKDFDDMHRFLWGALGSYAEVKQAVRSWLEV